MLFGCPLELCGVGGLKKIPPVLGYLLDSVPQNASPTDPDMYPVGQTTEIVATNLLH
jgi:hypothetical protein